MPDLERDYERGVGANPTVDAAAWRILGPGLRGEISPLLPSEVTWTFGNARELHDRVSQNNISPSSFLEKLEGELRTAREGVIVLAGELMYLQVLPLSNVGAGTKIDRIETVLGWTSNRAHLDAELRAGLQAESNFNGGAGFSIGIWQHLPWLCSFVEHWTSLSDDARSRALRNPWAFREVALATPGNDETALRLSLQELVWPGYFDNVVKLDHRRRIRAAFEHHLDVSDPGGEADLDYDLWRIRERIQESGKSRIDWYIGPYLDEWGGLHGQLKTVEGQRAWLVRPGQGGGHLADIWRVESFVSLPATNLRVDLDAATEASIRDAIESGYTHLDYAQRLQLTQADQAFILRMAPDDLVLALAGENASLGVVSGNPSWSEIDGSRLRRSVDWLPGSLTKSELPEPLSGMLDRQGDVVDLTSAVDVLTAVAARLTDTREGEGDGNPPAVGPNVALGVSIPPATDALVTKLHIPRETLQEYLDVLADRQQIVFYGPPGTGKTFIAEALGAHIVGTDTNHRRTVQFHPSYAYEDFFEGLRPAVEGGNVLYAVVPGPLRNLVAEATTPGNESKAYVLVIDEMNRANLAKVFGELYYLLEYRDQSISLQYSPETDFRLPKNLFIIGTMNTLDRSISIVDAAIRRRFPFVELHPAVEPVSGVLDAYLKAQESDDMRARLLNALNESIDERDLQIGPSYLMKNSARDYIGLERIWKYDILPLLDDHFYGVQTPEQVRAQFGLAALLAKVDRAGAGVGPVDVVTDKAVTIAAPVSNQEFNEV
ncbi:restriction endonuclease [Rathayibacter sp. AY1D7]|uniref:McrB family protein n=1 Tax=Rathayibacter sp. AY1D7 TaxID=2080547 RepID=UPI000CE79EDB|nr:AAA family ATPase [Rathayibacter sp. AY1D7]PPH67292.1 restriction endonuclease [Rathayibacter sp. AY1D7]